MTIDLAMERRIEAVERDAWIDLFAATPERERTALGLECKIIDDGALFICRKVDHIQFNRLTGLGLRDAVREQSFDRALDTFDRAGVKNWIIHVPPHADGLLKLCEARRLKPHARTWAKFIRGDETASATSTLAVRIADAAQAAAFGATAIAGFGMPPFLAPWLSAIVGRPKWQCFLAYEEDRPVAAGALFLDPPLAWLGVGATLPAYRGRGAQLAILAARISAAARAGCTILTTETGIPHAGEASPSFNNIQRAGFRIAYERPNYARG